MCAVPRTKGTWRHRLLGSAQCRSGDELANRTIIGAFAARLGALGAPRPYSANPPRGSQSTCVANYATPRLSEREYRTILDSIAMRACPGACGGSPFPIAVGASPLKSHVLLVSHVLAAPWPRHPPPALPVDHPHGHSVRSQTGGEHSESLIDRMTTGAGRRTTFDNLSHDREGPPTTWSGRRLWRRSRAGEAGSELERGIVVLRRNVWPRWWRTRAQPPPLWP